MIDDRKILFQKQEIIKGPNTTTNTITTTSNEIVIILFKFTCLSFNYSFIFYRIYFFVFIFKSLSPENIFCSVSPDLNAVGDSIK